VFDLKGRAGQVVLHGVYGRCDCSWVEVGGACRRSCDEADLARRAEEFARLALLSGFTPDDVLEATARSLQSLGRVDPGVPGVRISGPGSGVSAAAEGEDRLGRRGSRPDLGGDTVDSLLIVYDGAVDSDHPLLAVRCFGSVGSTGSSG
jgi:hypothetical protein